MTIPLPQEIGPYQFDEPSLGWFLLQLRQRLDTAFDPTALSAPWLMAYTQL
jgi:hypothetical protein